MNAASCLDVWLSLTVLQFRVLGDSTTLETWVCQVIVGMLVMAERVHLCDEVVACLRRSLVRLSAKA